MCICEYVYCILLHIYVYVYFVCVCVLSLSPGNLLQIRTVVPSLVRALMHYQTVDRHHVAGVS